MLIQTWYMNNRKYYLSSCLLLICFFLLSCKNASIKPSKFIEEFVTYYIDDPVNKNLTHHDYIIKVITKCIEQKYYIDVIGYEKDQLTNRDQNNYGLSYIKKYKVLYYGEFIPELTTFINHETSHIRSTNVRNIEYDPIVFRIVINKITHEFVPNESYKVNSLIDNQPLKKLVEKYF